jgi:hypothetical protein
MTDSRIFLPLIRYRSQEIRERAERLGPNVVALRERPAKTSSHDPVTVRQAVAADGPQLHRLADLDSARVPTAPVLLGERAGRVVAALSLADGAVVADPFVPTTDLVDLLALRARQISRETQPRQPQGRGLRGWRLARERGT